MKCPVLAPILLVTVVAACAQTESARISGRVTDLSGAVIMAAECKITNIETNISITTTTNDDGIYVIPDLRPATYRLTIQKEGFRTVVQPSLQLYVQDAVNENFMLPVGPVSESIIVPGSPLLQTDSAVVSTVVDQQFVQNMPLNGRSFQSLIALTPGVVFTSTDIGNGQFSANGQRSNANYFMVDGVSANFGVASGFILSETIGGAIPALTSAGGTNGLVSVDAMREFRIQTSTYAPEFGRTPGAQISIVTKTGTNQFHGTAYDYLRNDIFDARNWFDSPPLPKPPLRQNDFGGTLGGAIIKNKTFFFFSYEGLRLQLPQTATGAFYTESARAAAAPAYQPFINALPLPPANAPLIDPTCQTPADPTGCTARLTVAYSNPSTLNATSIRVDHNLTPKITFFARYNNAPSRRVNRVWEDEDYDNANTDTLTAGATFLLSPTKLNDFRANWSRNTGSSINSLTNFYGAVVPPNSVLFPPSTPYRFDMSQALVIFPDGIGTDVRAGTLDANVEKQLNFVDTFTFAVGAHQLKFGIDFRRINSQAGVGDSWLVLPSAFASVMAGSVSTGSVTANNPFSVNTSNYSLFAQDTWKATNRLTLTYGLRWEINTPPVSANPGQPLYATQGIFDSNPLAVVPAALWHTRFSNFAPRFGAAYQLTPKTVARGGFGLFYDLGYGDFGLATDDFPYYRFSSLPGPLPFNLTTPAFQPPPFSTTVTKTSLYISAYHPQLQLPFTMQWNVAIEREIGTQQTLTATYVGSDGRRLLRQDVIVPPSLAALGGDDSVDATRNAGYSHYNALQIQFRRRMSHGLQALVSYTLAKSTDLGSSDESGATAPSVSQIVLPPLTPSVYDIRQSIAGAVSYEIPAPAWGRTGNAILKGWAVDGLVRVASAWPINVTVGVISPGLYPAITQPDIVPGQPYWLAAPTQPGGEILNPAAFTQPPAGQTGNFPRNGLRGLFSLDETDFALRRRFSLTERVKLDLRAEYFNVFNHPMFGAPGSMWAPYTFWGYGGTPQPLFGVTSPILTGGPGTTNYILGGQSPQYEVGGPRSGQFTVKLLF